jgi:hypothetical protein
MIVVSVVAAEDAGIRHRLDDRVAQARCYERDSEKKW